MEPRRPRHSTEFWAVKDQNVKSVKCEIAKVYEFGAQLYQNLHNRTNSKVISY